MPKYKDGLGRNGTASLKLSKFRKDNEWMLENFPHDKTKIVAILTFEEWCEVTEYCIKNKISKVSYIRELLLTDIRSKENKIAKKIKRSGKKINLKQGKLF